MDKKLIVVLTGGLLFGLLFLALPSKTMAYSIAMHQNLTREIIDFYEISTGKKDDEKFTNEQKQWITQGSEDEDKSPRYINHFYDPVFERGLDGTAWGLGYGGYSAKKWAQFSSYQSVNPENIGNLWTGNGPVISGSWWGDFSYEAALKDYSKSKEKEAYIALGHILHLIEDMTVPEHTRNDPHPGGILASRYENWTKENSAELTKELGKKLLVKGDKLVIYADLESYFNNLSIYTNTHFFSPRTIKSEIYSKPKIVFEDGTFAYGVDEKGEYFDLAFITINKSLEKNYYVGDEHDQVMQEYWLRLSRQAVINGAGVVQLFMNQAEAARQEDLAKQGQKNSMLSQISGFLTGLFGQSEKPDMVIISESEPAQPKIKPAVQTQPVPAAPKKSVVTEKMATNPTPAPAKPITPAITTPANPNNSQAQSQAQTQNQNQTQTPQTTAPVVYSGGGSSSSQNTQTQTTQTNTESLNVSTFQAGDLVINEIMHNPQGSDTDREWIEIYNNSSHEIDLTGWKLNDETNHGLNVPPDHGSQGSMILPAGGYAILAENAGIFLTTDYPSFSGTVIDTAALNLKQDISTITTLKIITPDGTVIDGVTYYNSWGGNDDGKTLERKSAAGGSNDQANWGVSSANGGTPGAANNWALSMSDIDSGATSTDEFAASTTPPILGLGTDVPATTTITTNTTWNLVGSPYRLFFNGQNRPTVASGATLTIESGVKIVPQGGNYIALEIQGTLSAIATSGAPIIFTSINDADDSASTTPQKGEWLNIAFSQGSQANLDYVEFRYGGQGIERPLKEMVKIVGATVNINHSKFENSQSIALRLVDSNSTIENSIFSDNACGISVDSLVLPGDGTSGGCYGVSAFHSQAAVATAPQIRNNQFIRNEFIAIEARNGSTPVIDNNIFTDNGYPVRIESSYPAITNSQIANSTTSPNILNGIAISGRTHFSQSYTLKKDLPYILETEGPTLSPYIDSGATLTIEPEAILKTGHTYSALYVNGNLVAQNTTFTSLKDDARGGDTNGDGSASSPQDNDWANIRFNTGAGGNLSGATLAYGGYGYVAPPPTPPILLANFPAVDISWDNSEKISSSWTADKNGSFEKVIFHSFAANNPNHFSYLAGIKRESDNIFVASTTLANISGIVTLSDFSITLSGNFTTGEKYYAALQVIAPEGSSIGPLDLFHVGKDANQKAAVALYEAANSSVSNPALSIDSGASVVIQ